MVLLDTTALSELTKRPPNVGYMRWINTYPVDDTFIGAPTIGELHMGIELLDPSKRKAELELWFGQLLYAYRSRIIAFDADAAMVWGRAVAEGRRAGRALPTTDSQIAAIAWVRRLSVVTRNVRHFDVEPFRGLTVINPWE